VAASLVGGSHLAAPNRIPGELIGLDSDTTFCPAIPPSVVPQTSSTTIPQHFAPVADISYSAQDEWGDSVQSDPGNLHRIYFQNIDGVRNNANDIDLSISSMAHTQTGTFCWADLGLNFSQPEICQNIQKPLHTHFRSARTAFSSSALPVESRSSSGYQPGELLLSLRVNRAPEASV
jgi:hypothetical protein